MRPEKSKLLKISLCVLSCVFFGCGDNKSNGGGAGTEITSESIDKVLTEQSGKDIQKENPFMKVFEKVLQTPKVKTQSEAIETLMNKPTVKTALENGNFEDDDVKKLLGLVENFVDEVNGELTKIVNNNKILDTMFEVPQEEIKEWENIGVKDKNVAKAISDLNTIHLMLDELRKDPLYFLVKNGKGFFHNGTIKAVYLAWRNFVDIVEARYTHCKKCLGSIQDEKLKTAVNDSLQKRLDRLQDFVDKKSQTKRNILNTVYTKIGNRLLAGHGEEFLDMIYCYEKNEANSEGTKEDLDFKVTSDWSKWVLNHYYLGVRSNQKKFSTVASAHHGENLKKLKPSFSNLWEKDFWKNYEKILKDFVAFANQNTFKKTDVNEICKYFYDEKKNTTKEIYLSPWLMLCAQNKEKEIFEIIEFIEGDIKIKDKKEIKNIVEGCKNDNNNEKLEVYAGIFGLCNFVVAVNCFNGKEAKNVENTTAYKLSDKLKDILLKKRLAQWDKIKKDILTDKKDKKNEEEK